MAVTANTVPTAAADIKAEAAAAAAATAAVTYFLIRRRPARQIGLKPKLMRLRIGCCDCVNAAAATAAKLASCCCYSHLLNQALFTYEVYVKS